MANETEINATLPGLDSSILLLKLFRRVFSSLIILVMIAILTLAGLYLAQQGRRGLPVELLPAVRTISDQLFSYLSDHPRTYIWHKVEIQSFTLVFDLFKTSAGLLAVSLLVAGLFGTAIGILAALSKRKITAPLMVMISILGISTPSFLLAMFLWVLNLAADRAGWISASLPPTGFGWDVHLILPVLVLAARPFAQIMQVTYVNLSAVLNEDYMRAARARGGSKSYIIFKHAIPNILIPVLTTLTTSLRFSLSSLPVIETFFLWPGLGLAILQAITLDIPALITDLTVSLGLLFLTLNFLLDFIYPLIDPRLRADQSVQEKEEAPSLLERVMQFRDASSSLPSTIANFFSNLKPKNRQGKRAKSKTTGYEPTNAQDWDLPIQSERRQTLRAALTNVPLILGLLVTIGLVALVIWGAQMTSVSPDTSHDVMMIEGKVFGAPFEPSEAFPWGTDKLGRDIQALVLVGARKTLVLAFLAVIARLLIGVILGLASGWWQDSWFDRLIQGLISIWSAFPVTVFTALLILGLGIQRGISVFIIALCVVGWGEITQYIRSQVIAQKPSLYIEAARSIGAHSGRILFSHILPHLLPGILVLGALEMGGVLMLLAELGFLNIFLGGGFRVELTNETIYSYSDIAEWGAMLANIRTQWRSYPWVAWAPGLAFFISILGFNLLGDGLRRFLEETRININRFINRYSMVAMAALVVGVYWMVQSTAPVTLYKDQALTFDASRAVEDIVALTSPEMEGRESGLNGQKKAADYIAGRMNQIGLFPAGTDDTFLQELSNINYHLTDLPWLEILDQQGNPVESMVYRQDFVEGFQLPVPAFGEGSGHVVGLAVGNGPAGLKEITKELNLQGKVLLLRYEDVEYLPGLTTAGMLVINETEDLLNKRYLSPFNVNPFYTPYSYNPANPILMITEELGDRLLKTAGSSLTELDAMRHEIGPNELVSTSPGLMVSIGYPPEEGNLSETCQHVIGYIPGTGAHVGERRGAGLDQKVIMVSAYYDGLGIGPEGTLYPGANDNASGVAEMLEVARVIKNGHFQPEKTLVFVAWCGGERREGLSLVNILNAKIGFSHLEVEAVIELTGMAQGDGKGVALGKGTSYRLTRLIEKAAERLGVSVTTRGRDTHIDYPSAAGYGGRKALSAYLSWDGSDVLAHTPEDNVAAIDPEKLQKSGELTSLLTIVLSRETNY